MNKLLSFVLAALLPMALSAKDFEENNIFASAPKGKIAILVVHFGTTHADTRKLTLDVLNDVAKKTFPDMEVREAYTSRIIIKRLHDKFQIDKPTPQQALMKLYLDGYTHVIIQSSTLIDGSEMLSIRHDADQMRPFFKEIRISSPILYTPDDYEKVIAALTKGNSPKTAYVWVGHGTSYANTAQYAMMAYMLRTKGIKNCFLGTIEGYPTFENMLTELKASGLKNVELLPFMMVAGEHAKYDISDEWKELLEKEGFRVSVRLEGMGENTDIQKLFGEHLKFATSHRHLNIMEKKEMYRNTGEKLED